MVNLTRVSQPIGNIYQDMMVLLDFTLFLQLQSHILPDLNRNFTRLHLFGGDYSLFQFIQIRLKVDFLGKKD